MDAPAAVRERLLQPLAAVRRRARLYLALDAVLRVALLAVCCALVQLALDWSLKLTVDQRIVIDGLLLVIVGWFVLLRLVVPLLTPIDDRLLATALDRAHPEDPDRIATAVQFARGEVGPPESNSPQLIRLVLEEACAAAPRLEFDRVLNHRRARRRTMELGGFVLVVALGAALLGDTFSTWFQRNWMLREAPWPQRTYIRAEGFDASGVRRAPRGDELRIDATVAGEVPPRAALTWSSATGARGRELMTVVGGRRLSASLGTLEDSVRFQIRGGDEETREYRVIAVDRPQVEKTIVTITPPAYAGQPPATLEQQTLIELLAGSTLEIEAILNKPVATFAFVGSGGPVGECQAVEPQRIRMRWSQPASGAYQFELADADGWTTRRPLRFVIKVQTDEPPQVRLKAEGVGEVATPSLEFALELSAKDGYGLGAVALRVQRGEDPPIETPVSGFQAGLREFQASMTLEPARLVNAAAGDRVRIWADAADGDPAGPNVGRSEPIDLRIVTVEDFLAEMARRELELRREFEHLISAQRGLKDGLDRLVPDLADGAAGAGDASRIIGLARRQDAQAGRCNGVARKFEQLLAEMRTSRVLRPGDDRRISERVAAPLRELGTRLVQTASRTISELRDGANEQRVSAATTAQNELLRQMRQILSNMLQWEGYQEAVALLQDIIGQQQGVRAETLQAIQAELEAILGDLAPTTAPTGDRPKP